MLAAVLYCIQSTQYYYAFLGLHSFTVYFINSVEFHSFWHILYRIVKYYLVFRSSTMFIMPWYFKSMKKLFFFFKTRERANKGGKKWETSFSYRNCHRVSGTYTTYNNETDKKYYCKHHLIDDVDQTECC